MSDEVAGVGRGGERDSDMGRIRDSFFVSHLISVDKHFVVQI